MMLDIVALVVNIILTGLIIAHLYANWKYRLLHSQRDRQLAVLKHDPSRSFRIVPIEQDLSPTERAKYRVRQVAACSNGDYVYYGPMKIESLGEAEQ